MTTATKPKFNIQMAQYKNKSVAGMMPFEFDSKKGDVPDTIHLIPIGAWEHDSYGPIIINAADIREYVQNFNQKVRKGVFITAGHEGFQELPAVGWVVSVEARDTGLWGVVEWTPEGKRLLSDKAFKFFSPELCRDYEDPETHQFYRNVMTGGALTKSPYFKELEAIVFSEKGTKTFNSNEPNNMNLQELLAKDITTLTDEEKAFIKSNAAELTDEQKASHASVIEEPVDDTTPTETEEQKVAREAKEKEDANIAAGLNADGTPKETPAETVTPPAETIEAAEKGKNVVISASELDILRKKADDGAKAFAELKAAKITADVKELMFSENNKAGVFLPKGETTVRAFMETLNETQTAKFKEVLKSLVPNNGTFKEIGEGAGIDATAQAEVETKVNAKLTANPKMKYSEALKEVMSENEGLEERYSSELPSAVKKS